MVNVLPAILSGILLFSGFAPLELWPGPFLGIALLFSLLNAKSFRQRISLSFIAGMSFFLPLLHWSSVYVGSIPWLVLATGESAIFALIGLLRWHRQWHSALSFAALFTLIELLRMKWPFGGFGWGRMGFTQIDSMTALYPIVGVTGVSLLIACSSFALLAFRRTIFIFGVIFLASTIPHNFLNPEEQDRVLHVTAVQGGVDKLGFDFNDRALRVLERHVAATPAISKTDLYVWPENASDVDPLKNERANSLITDLIEKIDSPLLVGAVESTSKGPMNSSLLFDSDVEIESRYVKQDLAPFGEYMPVRKMAEAISPYAKSVRDFVPGTRWVKHYVSGIPFQSLICFEVLDDDHAKSGIKGTSFVVTQTNNATFGRSYEAAQQLQITRSRAAESGRNFVVVSTTGFTSHLDSSGHIVAVAKQFSAEALTMKVGLVDPASMSLAQRFNSLIWTLGLLLILGLTRMRINR